MPLSNQAIDILKPMKTDDETDKIGDVVFSGSKKGITQQWIDAARS